ncbi:uncharacterized protein LOC131298839 isoform X5 [Rhododendron vialii]|uniref:uncharacterized protein LOC131298839 isoform X5 n=1 Tax=Rhododendron vialii TaxID=182163 RepID=UPI00265FF5AB|nr:uncharacterized protein LOC131298839 isoform X5 [Rhododendron vialii]
MATEADVPDPISLLKREVEDKEMTSELPSITVSEGPKEEKKRIESWLSQPPEIIEFFGKTEAEEVGNDDEVANMNVINKGSVETVEGDVFSKSLSVADEESVRYAEHSQVTSEGEKSKSLTDSVGMEMDPETIRPTIDMADVNNKHGSSLLDAPVEETTSEKAGTVVGECVEESMSVSRKEASQETLELAEEMKDSTSAEDELPHKNLESSFFEKVGEFFFHKADNLETSAKESEPVMKDFVKESQHEAEHKSEILENIATADSDQSTTGMHDEIQDTKADVSFGRQRESTERDGEDHTPTDSVMAEEQQKTETSTHEEQSGLHHMQKTEGEAPMDSEEIETEGSSKYAETITNIEERRPIGSPEEIYGEKPKDEMISADDINKNEVQVANDLPTIELDEKTRSAELEIPNKSGSELWIAHPPVGEEVQEECKKKDEVSMSESGDPPEAIQFPNKEEKHVNEISEATESLESTISEPTATEGELNVEAASTSEIDSNTEKVCGLKSEEALKEINAEDNVEEEREQTEDELPPKNLESSFFEKVKGVFFHKVDNLETSAKESEPGMKDFVKESQQEAGHKSEILENIAAADNDQSSTGMHDEIQDMKADVSFGRQRESTEREGEDRTPTDSVVAEEQEKTETSTLEEQSGQSYMQKAERKASTDSKEIETQGSDKYAKTVTNIEEQREVIVGEKPKDGTINTDDINKNEVQEVNTRSAELEIPNKNGSELWIAHPPVEQEVQVECKKQDEVSMSESEDPPEAIQFPNKEEKHVNEISEATESLESTISEPTATERELNVEATSTSEIDSNTEKGCELKSEEALEDNVEEREQTEDELPHKNLESSFFEKIKGVFFHKVDNLETSAKESEPGMKDFVKESQHETEHEKEIHENIAAADGDQSKTGMHDEIQDTKADVSFGRQRESTEREGEDHIPTDSVAAEEHEKTETSTQEEQSGQRHVQSTEREAPMDSNEIETEGSDKYAETITNIEEQRPVGSPDEIVGEKPKDEMIIDDDINKNEVQEANNRPTVDLDEKTESAELEIPNKSGSELWITHPPIEEEVQADREKQNEVSMSESEDPLEAIQFPNKEEKHVNETSEATESSESTISGHTATEGELNIEETSTRERDINTEKGCELKSEETVNEINAEDNTEGEREQIEKASDTEFFVERKTGGEDGRSTIEEDIPVKKRTSGEEEYHYGQEEQVSSSNSFPEELTETVSGDQSYITSDETKTIDEQIIYQEVCEDPKLADRAEDIEKEMENEENTITDFSPEPTGERPTKSSEGNETDAKKHEAEAYGESTTMEESAITDLPSSDVWEDKVEESLKEDRREAMIPDKEVWNSNIESRERDSEATHSRAESTAKELKDEAEANEGLNAQSTIGSSSEETAQESDSNLVQSSSAPDIIEKEVNKELLEKEDSKGAVEAEETRLTEAESEYPIGLDSSNLISEEKGQATAETSEMRSNDIDVVAESAEISFLGDNEDMEIPTARKDGADESTEKTQPEGKTEYCDELSKPEDQREIAAGERSLDYVPELELMESSPVPLEADNLVTEVSETPGEALEKEKTSSDKEETPLVAEATEEYIAETEGDSTIQGNDTNMGSIDIGKESTIDNALVRELHAPLELNDVKSISESDVELLKGVNPSEADDGSNISKLETPDDEKSSKVGVETGKSEYEEAVDEASHGIEMGGESIETEKTILEQEDSAKSFEGSPKEGVEMEKPTVEFESEAYSCGSDASETQTISTQTEKIIDEENKELASELPNVTVNEVPLQEQENTESWLSQPPGSIEILETECVQVAHDDEVGNVNVVDNVGTTEGESFLKSTSVADGELNENTEDDQLNTKEEMSGFQEEEGKAKMITDKNVMAEASFGQDEGVSIQTPELTGGSSRDIEVLNEVPHEGNMESLTSTETTSVEQDLKETSFEGEDKKSIALEMDPEATQPSTDIGEEKNKGEEMPCLGVKDVCISTETATENEIDEPTESNVGATDKLGSSLVTEPDVCKNLEENSSVAREDEIQNTGKLVERVKEDASIEDEVEKQNLESSFVKRAENVETSKEESETGMKDIDKETQKEAENQNKALENATTAGSNLSTEGEVVENQERKSYVAALKPEDSVTRESEDITPAEVLTMECEPGVTVFPGEDNVVVEEQEATETSKHEEHSEQILKQNTEPAKANLGSSSVVASEEFETTSLNDYPESISKIEGERPVGSPEEKLGDTIIAADINEDGTTEAKNLSMDEGGEKKRSAEFNIPNDNVNEVHVTPRPVEEPEEDEKNRNEVSMLESEEQDRNETETARENLGSPSIVALEEFETTSHDEYAESITKIEEERPVGNPEEIIGEQRSDEIMIADDSNNEEIPEAESLSAVDSYEKTRSAEIKIPDNNTREVCVTHPPVEETVLEGGEKQNEVSLSESVDQVHEASASEVPEDEEKHANDSYEASKSPDSNISEHTCIEGESNTEATTSAKEIPAGSQEEILWQPRKDESMIKIPEAENPLTVDSYVTPPSVEETFLDGGETKNDVSILDQVHEASEVPTEEEKEKEKEKESKDTYEATESPESNILEDTSTEGAVNIEATSTRSAVDITLDKGFEPVSEDELEELKAEENLKEQIEQKEKAADVEFQMPTISDDKENSTIKGESLVEKNTPTCTGEGEYHHDQEDEGMSNRSNEASHALDSGEQSCSTSNEIKIIDDQIMNEETIRAHEDPKIADSGEDTEDLTKNEAHTVADLSPEPTGEHITMCPQENETEVLEKLPMAEGSANMGIQTKEEHSTTKDNFDESYGEETRNECSYDEEKEEKEPDTAASNVYGTAPASTATEERSISDLPSSLIEEEKAEERLKEDREDEIKAEIEVSNSHAEAFDAMHSTEQREDMALQHEAEANEDFNAESITESSSEETTQKDRNVDLVENSSSVPEICKKEIKEEVLEKEDPNVPVVAEETSSTQVEGENIRGLDSADLVFEEKGQVSTETSQMGSNATDLIDNTVETSILGENDKTEIPTAREVATVETSLDDISEQMLQVSSIQTSKEHDLVSPEVGETTGEAPEKDEMLYEKAETSLAEETTEDEIREIEADASSNPVKDTDLGSIDKEKERANAYAAVEDREFYTPPEQNIEESTSESDAEVLRRVTTSEVADRNEISKSEAVEELKSSEKDKPEYDTAISETSEGVETCGGYMDTEKVIPEQEDSAKNLEGSSKENDEIEKVPVKSKAETHGSETSEATSISTLKEENMNINIVEHDETAAESTVKDEGSRRFPETNPTNTEEESHDDENQTIASTDEQISRQDIEKGKKEMNEAMETKLETQEEINRTQDAILTEKVSTEIESASERETIKEQNMKEESCTKELHMLPAADNEVRTVIESASESEIIKEQIKEEESCTEEFHKRTAADETARETDLTPIQSLEATASNKNAEMMGSNIAEDFNMESEATEKEVNETEDAFSTEEVSTETSLAMGPMDEVTYPDLTAVHSLEATDSNEITEMMESKSAKDLNEESEASPMAEVLEDETKNIEKPVDVSSLASEGSDEKTKGEKIDNMEICDDETDTAPTVVTDLPSLGEVQLNDEPVKALDTSSDAESQHTTRTADAGEREIEETSIIASQFPIQEHENADNANIHVEKSDVEVEATEIPDSVSQTEDQAVKEIHETGTSLNVIDGDTKEIENQIREVPEVLLEPTNQHADAARDDEITPGQTPQAEKTEEQLQVPSTGLLSEEQESETTTRIRKGSTNEDAMEEAKMRQAEVSMIREELETTSEGEGIENQVQGKENRVRDLSTVSSAEELDAESLKDNSVITEMSAQEVLETNHGGQDTDEPVKALVTSSDTGSLQATETSKANHQELDETSRVVSQLPVDECEKSENISANVDKSDTNNVEENELEIPGAVPEPTDQRVQEIQEIGISLPVGEAHTSEIAYQTREVPEVLLEPTNQHADAAREDEITPGQTPHAEKTEEQLQVPSSGLLSEKQETEITTGIGKGSTNKDAMEEEKMHQAEVSMIREELETTSEGEGIENQVQGEENRVRDLSRVSSAEELDAESSKDNSIITEMSAQEVLETNHGGLDTYEPVKALVTSSDAGSLQTTETSDASQQELDEASSVVCQFPVDECEKSENISASVDKSDTYDVEEKELEIPGAVPEPTDQRVQEIQETGTSVLVGEAHTSEIAYQTREVPGAFSEAIKQGVEAVSGDEIIAPAGETKETSLGELQLNEHVEAPDTHSSSQNLDTIKTADASQHNAEFEHMKLEETIHEHEEADRESIPLEKSEDNYAQVEETEIPDTVPESEHQAVKEIHVTGKILNVGDTDANEIGKPISEVPEALLEAMNQGVDPARNDQIISSQIVQGEKLEEQLEAPSSGLVSMEQESETTTTDKKGSTDRDDIEGTKMLQAEIREKIETTGEGKGFVNQVQAEEKRAQDWSTVPNAKELDAESSTDNAIITKMSTQEVLETNHGGHDTDEQIRGLDTSSDTDRLQTTQKSYASQQELEETSSMVSQLPVDIYEKPGNESVTEEKSDAYDVKVKEIDLPGVVPESSDQRVKEIHEVGTSVEEIRTEEVETQTREVCEALPEDVNQGGETVSGDEIIAPSEATKVTSLGELQLNDEHVEAPDTVKTGDGSQPDAEFDSMKCEETSIMVSQLLIHEHEKEESANIPVEKSDAKDVDVEEAEIPDTVPESEDQAVKVIHETGTSLTAGGADTNETEKQIRRVPEALSEPINPCFYTSRDDEMTPVQTPRAEKIEEDLQVPSSALLSKEEDGETSIAIEKGSTDKDVTEVGSLELQENSGSVFQLPVTECSANDVIEEKSEADEVELNETKALDAVSDSKDRGFEVIHEIQTIPAAEDTETDKVEDEIKEVNEKIPDLRYKGVDAATDGENLDHPLPVGKLGEQIQLSSSSYESTKEEAAELDKSEVEKFKDLSYKLPTTEHVGTTIETSEADEVLIEEAKTSEAISESKGDGFEEFKEIGSSPPVEKIRTDADEVELNRTKTLDAVSESKDQVFEEIHEIRTIPATEDTETEKVEDETKEVTEKIPDLRYKGADAATDSESLGHPLPVGKLEEKIQLSSSSYESTKEDATELDKSELEEARDMLYKLPTTEHGIRHVGTTIEESETDEVQVEEAKTSEAISESKGDGFEEFKEFGSSPPVEKTRTDEIKEETKAVPETIFEPTYQDAQTAVDVETAINQTLTPQGVEQLHEPKSTTEKSCLQDEGQRELEVSNLELKLQKDSQDISPDEENKGLEKRSTDAPSQYEERPVQQSLQEASTDEDIVYSKNSNKDADNLPTPYPTVTEHSTEDIGGKYEEVSNLEFEKNGEVLLESVSAINSPSVPLTSEGIEVIKETPKENTTELGDRENNCEETTEEEAIEKHTSTEKISEEMQGSRNFDQISLQEDTATKTNQEDELRAEDYPGERTNKIFDASRNEIQPEMVFKESEEDCVDNNVEGVVRAADKGPHQVSVSDEIANQSMLESHGDETAFTDTATEATARIEELKSSEAMLVSHEVERAGDIDEETAISKDGQLQNKDLVVPPVADKAAEEALDGKELETLDDFSERGLDTNDGNIEPYEHKKEIATAGTIDSESLVDNEKLGHPFPEPGCDGSGGTEDLDLTKKDGSNEPSISSTTATSHETLADEASEKAVDTKQHHFMSDEQTAEPESIPEEGNGFQLEAHTMDKEPVELSVMADEAKLDENKIRTTTAIEEEESPQENEKPNVLPHIMDSETEVSREAVTMNISDDIQGPEKTSLAIPHEQIASKTDPSESIERTNSKGMECGEENRMVEQSKEITEESQMIESAKMSLSDLLQRSTKRNVQVGEDVTEERELMGIKEEPQNETAKTVEAEEEAVHDKKDEEEEGDELKREDSGSDAPVMVEASRDMDVKIAHKKPHHHNILSGVGSKVKHSLAKVKKAITGKSSHPKPTSPK